MGRPTKCTPAVRKAYCLAIIDGLSYESAAAEAGVFSESTILEWRERGANGEEPFASFARDEKKAKASWERKRLKAMDEAGQNWAREAWKLERRMPDEYGKKETVRQEHTGANGGPVAVEMAGVHRLTLDGEAAAAVVRFHAADAGGARHADDGGDDS